MRKLTIALSTAALAMAGAAYAQPASDAGHAAKPDMTRADAQARAEAAFARLDANRDGTLDSADREARRGQMFDRIDTDRNGTISRAEFDAMHAQRAERGGKGHRMGGKMEQGGHQGMMGKGMMGHGMMGKGATQGPITRQAFVDRALSMFDRADANRDGKVTQAERQTMRDSMRSQMQARRAARQQG